MVVNRMVDMDNIKFKLVNNAETPKQKLHDYVLVFSIVFSKYNNKAYV